MAIKALHQFDVIKKISKEVKEETAEGILTKKVEAEQPYTILIKRPRRDEAEEADFIHAQEYGKCFRAGLLTNAMVNKRLEQDDYLKSQNEKAARYSIELENMRSEYQSIKSQEIKSDIDEQRLIELEKDWLLLQGTLQSLQDDINAMFNDTAETKARNRTIVWLTLHLTYIKDEGGNERPFFRGDSFEAKLKHLDALNDLDEPFNSEVINKANFYITLWYLRKVITPEDFQEFDKSRSLEEEEEQKKQEVEATESTEASENAA